VAPENTTDRPFKFLFLKGKAAHVGFFIFSVLLGIYSIHGIVSLGRQTHTRAVERELVAAADQLEKSPPGIHRAETFVRALKKIDPGQAPDKVRTALADYIAVLEQGLDALKAGRDTTQYDADIAKAKERLMDALKEAD
jgi:hypothetical protein